MQRAARLTVALAALLATAVLASALAACAGADGGGAPQAGVAPRGASSVDAGVTTGAITYQVADLAAMMADTPSKEERFTAASLAGQKNAGGPARPKPRLDPDATPDYYGVANWANSPRIRKFVDSLPGVGAAAANDLGQYIPVAVPDTVTYPGSDYYEIAVREYSEKLHRDLPPTWLRGYVQLNLGTDGSGRNSVRPSPIHYFGPLIQARRGRPVRVKFVNQLPAGKAGDLFLPVDTTTTGTGTGPAGGSAVYPQNRASLHLHGGITPWISGGSQYQWITPAGEKSPYSSGPGLVNVPDMWFDARGRPVDESTPGATNDPGPGATTLYFPNDQSARFLYLHDDTYGLTRLSVYAGEASPYFIADPVEDELVAGNAGEAAGSRAIDAQVAAGTVPAAELPLIIEDKTFVPGAAQLRAGDPTWDLARWGGMGGLWYPHVYMPNQYADGKVTPMGRWDYLPWYWKGYEGTENGPVPNPLFGSVASQPKQNPGTPDLSVATNAFHDTMLVNGTAYPYARVERKAYRLRILNACADRQLNLQLYYAISDEIARTGANGAPELQTDSGDVLMLPGMSSATGGWPARWPTDQRQGGVPDPRAAGPAMVQFGNDGGLLPQAATVRPTPVGLEYRIPTDQEASMGEYRSIIAVSTKALYLAPGERADVVVDFSKVPAGSKLILYNDAPAPAPNADSRVDYYTGDVDQVVIGGAPTTLAGHGPNTRTIMQFQVDGPAAEPFDVQRLRRALPAAYAAAQDPVLVPMAAYRDAFGDDLTLPDDMQDDAGQPSESPQTGQSPAQDETAQDGGMGEMGSELQGDAQQDAAATAPGVPRAESGTLSFTPLGRGYRLTLPVQGKMVSDLFDPTYGRKTATLGVDAPLAANGVRTAVPYSAVDPATEYLAVEQEATAPQLGDATQVWRITHDGTMSHSIAFGGVDVQVLERERRDGEKRAPDPGELGWKDTLCVDPLESVLIAVRPVLAGVPFKLPASTRALDVTLPPGSQGAFTQLDPITAAPASPEIVNVPADLSFEARWGIHLTGGEESHTARPLVLQGTPAAPEGLTAIAAGDGKVELAWTAPLFPPPAIGYVVGRAADESFSRGVKTFAVAAGEQRFADATVQSGSTYFYRVRTEAAAGWSPWSAAAEVSLP